MTFINDGRVPETVVSDETANISPFCEFGFWDWVKFRDRGVVFPDDPLVLGNYLGASIDVGHAMMQRVMKANGKVEDRSTVRQLTPKERLARVLRTKRDSNGVLVGHLHKQPAMDTCVYKVHFPVGHTEELAANVIAELLYAHCDSDGNQYVILDAIMEYQKNPDVAVTCNNQVKVVDGKKVVTRSTRNWELCCEWKDGSTSWQKLPDLKESHPVQVAEFALAAGIADKPTFNWWVIWVLKKRDWIISLVKRQSA
ncbi:LOW QUALITY PROTEIN: hypothetical protein ACHAW6_000990 [Cyclotella cf. meneghiniana]